MNLNEATVSECIALTNKMPHCLSFIEGVELGEFPHFSLMRAFRHLIKGCSNTSQTYMILS